MKENSIKENIERLELCSTNQCYICGRYEKEECMLERTRCEARILSDYKRVLKENEELNKYVVHLTDEQYRTVIDLAQNDINQQWIQKVKGKIEEYKKMSDKLYIKFLEGNRYDTDIRDEGIKCDAIVNVLQELLEGGK